jgi:hypothetical protein
MRVSDAERQAAAERLRGALGEGRLDFIEYDSRLAKAFEAVTYADLDRLFTDLPVSGRTTVAPAAATPARPAGPQAVPAVRTGFADLPLALKILWSIYSVGLVINLTVWLLVSLGNAELEYFWPMWMAVPGIALSGATVVVQAARCHR